MSTERCLTTMYHYVRDGAGPSERDIHGLTPRDFEAQLDRLCDGMTPIDWPTLVAWRAERTSIPENAFLLTFDDGLADHFEVVFPILESRGLRGVFFVQSNVLIDGTMDSAHEIHLLIHTLGTASLGELVRERLASHGIAGDRDCFHFDPRQAHLTYPYETPEAAELKYLLAFVLPCDLRNELIHELFISHVGDPREYAARWYLQWDQIIALEAAGHTIGGHGHDHEPYVRLTVSEQARDMVRCASILREGLGAGRRPFSYPYGSHDEDIARRCAFCGFVNGFTTREGWVDRHADPHRLCRVDTINVDAFIEREFTCAVP